MWSIRKNKMLRTTLVFFGITLFSGLVTFLYYRFDYGMRDIHMTLLFLPGAIATLLFFLLTLLRFSFRGWSLYLFAMGFPFIWFYLLLMGIYSIAKTSSEWLFVYLVIGGLLMGASLIYTIVKLIKKRLGGAKKAEEEK